MATARRFNCSSSSSYDNDNATATTGYTDDDYNLSPSPVGGAGGDTAKANGLFQEAEEMIYKGLQDLFAVGTATCGLQAFDVDGKCGTKKHKNGRGGFMEEDEGIIPDWRKDPYHSLSDWTLIVRDGSNRQPQTYHIHKSVVSYGPRKSGFLIKVFEKEIMDGRS